jgi:hypothetical protein
MKTFFTKLLTLAIISFLWNNNILCQGISLSYERDLTDIDKLEGTFDSYARQAVLYADNGMALYFGREKTGFDEFVKLRNNNTIVWKTQVDKFPDNITPFKFYEHESGYFFVGDFKISSNNGGIGRLNKSTGNFEVKKEFSDLQWPKTISINGTHGGNIIVGGSHNSNPGGSVNDFKGMIRVVNPLGDVLFTRTSNQSGGLWGNIVNLIEKTNDNGYIISGIINENTICGEPNNTSWWICKLNSNLDVVWSRKYGNGNGTTTASKVVVLPNDDIIALGSTFCTNGSGGGINNNGEGGWFVKLNSSGNVIKYKNVGAYDLDLDCNNQLVVLSTSSSSYFIEKYDINLELISGTKSSFMLPNGVSLYNLQFQKGIDNTYLIYGLKYKNINNSWTEERSFIAKTTPDPACGTNPPLLLCENTFGQYSICEDFDKLQNGNIVPQGSPKFTLFSGSTDENATVTTEKAFSGSKSLKFTTISDIDFNIDRTIESPSRMEWMTYADAGKTGSWGLETSSPTSYALITRLNNGQGTVYTISNTNQLETRGTFTFTPGQWFKTALVFDNVANTIEVWINNKMIYSRTGHTSRKITDLNLYATEGSQNNLFYVDDLLYYETKIPCICTQEYAPVCVNDKEFSNACRARCAGYTENEWTQGLCGGGGGTTSLVFDIDDNVCGAVGQTVTIPVRVKGFTKVSSFQFTVSLADNTKGEITGIEKANIAGDLNFGLISPGTATVVWDNPSPLDILDNTVVINVKVRIKIPFTGTTDISIVGTPTDISADQNNQTVKPTVIKGSYCATANSFKICGKVTREDNVGVANVVVTLSGGKNATTSTNASGEYCFENLEGNLSYTVKPSKNTNHVNGVNTGDVTAIRRHILALEKLNSPYKIIAADASKSNAVNTGDVTEVRRLILALISQFSTTESWTFVAKSHVFTNPTNPFASAIPNTITINGLSNDQGNQDFVGIKMGDVNLSNNPSNINGILENRNSAEINLIVSSANVVGNQDFDIDITVKQFKDITSGQFSVNWSTGLSNYTGIKNLNTTLGLTNDNFNATQTGAGKLGFIWDSPTPINLPDDTKLFTISFKAKSNGTAIISITDDPVGKYFEDKDKKEVNVVVTNGSITVPTEDDFVDSKIKIYPNPSTGIISIESDFQEVKNIEIHNLEGKALHSISKLDGETIDLSHLESGIYFIKGFVNDQPFLKKLVLIQ